MGNISLRVSTIQNSVQDLKISLKFQIQCYHLLNQWLLGATKDNEGQTMKDL